MIKVNTPLLSGAKLSWQRLSILIQGLGGFPQYLWENVRIVHTLGQWYPKWGMCSQDACDVSWE
jgi:hypothetical protein